jgi:hypothetical protein
MATAKQKAWRKRFAAKYGGKKKRKAKKSPKKTKKPKRRRTTMAKAKRRRRYYPRKKKSRKSRRMDWMPKSVPQWVALGTYVQNMWVASGAADQLLSQNFGQGIMTGIQAHGNWQNWAAPGIAAGAGYLARKFSGGPGPKVVGPVRLY